MAWLYAAMFLAVVGCCLFGYRAWTDRARARRRQEERHAACIEVTSWLWSAAHQERAAASNARSNSMQTRTVTFERYAPGDGFAVRALRSGPDDAPFAVVVLTVRVDRPDEIVLFDQATGAEVVARNRDHALRFLVHRLRAEHSMVDPRATRS